MNDTDTKTRRNSRAFSQVLRRQFGLWLLLFVVLLAAYVSVGRQFMPAIAGYSGFFENQIYAITGVPVEVESLRGGFSGFNPVIEVNNLSIQVAPGTELPDAGSRALMFDRGRVVVDMARSILQRRWVLEEFVVERLELELAQNSDGGWLLGDIAMPAGAGIDPDTLYRAFLDVAQLDLRDVVVNVRTRSGEQLRFIDGAARIQNRNGNHFLHVDINPEGQSRPLELSLEVRGGDLSVIDGSFHAAVPEADYSYVFSGQEIAGFSVEAFSGGGDIWVNFAAGQTSRIVATAAVNELALRPGNGELTTLNSLSGAIEARIDGESTHYSLADVSFDHDGVRWQPANLYLAHQSATLLALYADRVDLAMLGSLATAFELLPDSTQATLDQMRPAGTLENLSLYAPLRENSGEAVSLRANVAGGAIASLRNTPAMSGLDGYLEVSADLDARRVSGLVEIDSTGFAINIPSVYTATWAYDAMNGSVNFDFDYSRGQALRLGSSVLAGRASGVESRVQFSSKLDQSPGGERETELELLVGVLQMGAAESKPFLPDGPSIRGGLRNGMAFLEDAIAGGSLRNSAAIFRGVTTQGSDRLSKTFQSFYQWRDGELRFAPDWPELNSKRALVHTDDSDIDILLENGSSRGLAANLVRGSLRTDESGTSLLVVSGRAAASAADGLAWFLATPAAPGLREALAEWRVAGDLQGGFELEMPLGAGQAATDIRLELAMGDSDLWISQYDLDLAGVNGELVFDTRTGIEHGEFDASLFGGDASIEVSSRGEPGNVERVAVIARGRAERRDLLQWPRQSGLVRGLLENARGSFLYAAELYLDQGGAGATSLRLGSDLAGLFLNLPEPFAKQAGEPLSLSLQVDQLGGEQRITGALGGELRFAVSLADAAIQQGRVSLGSGNRRRVEAEASRGLMVEGRLDRLALEQWSEVFADVQSASTATGDLHGAFAWLDLDAGEIDIYGQQLSDVRLRVDPIADGYRAALSGSAVQGAIEIPLIADDYLRVNLDYLRFSDDAAPAAESAAAAATEPAAAPRVDLLAGVDPRRLPRMQFSAGEIHIGDTPWGGWNFTLEPDADGADFTDLGFDFRGLRTAPAAETEEGGAEDMEPSPGPRLRWHFDGENHTTELAGEILTDDIAAVLLESGFAASLESERARFVADLQWSGSPTFFRGPQLSGNIEMLLENGRFLETTAGGGTLKLISIINFDAIMRRLRLSDDLLRRGLAFDEISGRLNMENGVAQIENELVISGPSSLYQITGAVDLRDETIAGEMYVTLPVSDNIPWIGLITGNLPLAVGAYLFDQIFGDQVDSLTSAVYTLEGSWEGLEPQFKQAFGAPGEE